MLKRLGFRLGFRKESFHGVVCLFVFVTELSTAEQNRTEQNRTVLQSDGKLMQTAAGRTKKGAFSQEEAQLWP